MIKSVASLFKTTSTSTTSTADIKTDITSSNTINTVENSTVTVPKETTNDTPLIHLVRQQRRQKLEETVLIRKIAHQSVTNYYEQDHLPLSHVQEKLKDDEAPLVQVQQQLEQQKNDAVIYTATKEKLKSIFYNQRMSYSFLTKPIQSRHTIPTSSANTSNNSTESNSTANNDVDDKDYDVWDDAVIGRIMNLVDTIGVDSQGTTQETEDTSSENPIENVTEKDGSKDNPKEEPMIFMNARENRIESMTEGLINFEEIISDNLKLSSNESAEEKDNT
ncbi:15855_t:CDS:1, partial [Funneliformis mosseae]